MQLVTGTNALKAEVAEIVRDSLKDSLTADYVHELLILPPIAGMDEIKLNWLGLQYSEFPEIRLAHSKEIGDKCFAVGIFYLEDLERNGQYQLLDLGKSSYRVAAMYSDHLGRYDQGHVFSGLSEQFFPAVSELSYNMMRRLGNPSPPERIVFWTPYGERLVLSRGQ